MNIVEKYSRQKPCNFVPETNSLKDDVVVNQYNNVTTSEIYKLFKYIDD